VTGAADIAGLPAGLPKRPASRGLASSLLVGLGLALACAAPLGLNGYALYLLTLAGIFALVALGLNLLTGYAGQISLCHAAFFGVGAYATALLTTKAGLPYLVSLPLGALLTTAIGAAAAVPALRLKNLYLAIATLGFGVVLQKIIFEWRDLTGGGGGLALSAPTIAGYELGATGLYYLTLAFVILGLWGAWNVSRGRTGRALRIIKESEIAAASLGIHIARYKVTAFALSAFYAALAGGLFAYLVRYINPESFNVGLSIAFLSMVVIGGLGTIGGSIVGAAFYVIVPELLRGIKDAPGLVFGLLLVVVMVFMPQGLWGMVRRLGWKR
jgi:branched-chain amino acid transport system permease protein